MAGIDLLNTHLRDSFIPPPLHTHTQTQTYLHVNLSDFLGLQMYSYVIVKMSLSYIVLNVIFAFRKGHQWNVLMPKSTSGLTICSTI